MYRVQHSVNKLHGFLVGEFPRQFQGFVDGHRGGRAEVSHFEDGQTQDVAVHGWHPFHPPVLGVAADALVHLSEVLDSSLHQFRDEGVAPRLFLGK